MIKGRNEAGMKLRVLNLILFAILLICCTNAVCEHTAQIQITADNEEWSWDPGAYNQFSGRIDLAEFCGKELTIRISTDLSYGGAPEEDHNPLFTVVNGHRITMLKQKSSAVFTPDTENPAFDFSASIKLPEKGHVRSIRLDFRIVDENGTELMNLQDTISAGDNAAGRENGTFYIPYNIRTIIWIITAAAALVWVVVLLRDFIKKKYRR